MAYSVSKEAQQLLCEIINQISLTEKKAEQFRIQLCRRTTFNLYGYFKKLDSNNINQISQLQLVQLLKENDIYVQDCNLFLKQWFQKDFLNYQDFLQFVLPKTDSELRELTAMKQPTKSPTEKSTEQMLAQLVNLEQNEAVNLERLKARLCVLYHPDQMFECVDSLNNRVLSFKDFDRFFRRNGLLIYEDELYSFFYRIDRTRSGQITLNDFRSLLELDQSSQQCQEVQQQKKSEFKQKTNPYILVDEENHSQAGQIIQLRCNSTSKSKQQNNVHRSSSISSSLASTKASENFYNSDQKFIDLGLEILKLEMYLEEIRLKLQSQKEFNSMDFFHFMDQKNRGKINQEQFAKFLQELQLKNLDIVNLFCYLDKDQDGYLRYSDISEFISPSNLNSSYFIKRPARNNQLQFSISQLFSTVTIRFIQELFNQWNENSKRITKQKSMLLQSNYNLVKLYEKLDTFKKGSFNRQDVRYFYLLKLQRYFEIHDIKDDMKLFFKQIARHRKEVTFQEFENFFMS